MAILRRGYRGREDFEHAQVGRAGVLLVNLGTPAAATPLAVRRYLAEFLNDPRVIELPPLARRALVHGVVLRVRPRRTARAYCEIWTEAGSPLLVYSRALEQALRSALTTRLAGPISLALAMRYGEPRITPALEVLARAGVERLLILPLYPQYSGATTGSAFDAVTRELQRMRWVPAVRFINHYHDHPRHIAALAESITAHWEAHGRTERLLFSFHGMPRATLTAGDPYHCHCQATARLVAAALKLEREEWSVAFQSRFGRAEWLRPATGTTLRAWAAAGIESVAVACPGFAVDCLETLEEVDIRHRKAFLDAGGKRFEYVPALNATAAQISALAEIAANEMSGWPEARADYSASTHANTAKHAAERARRNGAGQ
ncbi:MAG: ferrochelatase [Gammaproteobacteria bacterium]